MNFLEDRDEIWQQFDIKRINSGESHTQNEAAAARGEIKSNLVKLTWKQESLKKKESLQMKGQLSDVWDHIYKGLYLR